MAITYSPWDDGLPLGYIRESINGWGTTVQDAVNANEVAIANVLPSANAYTDAAVANILNGTTTYSNIAVLDTTPSIDLMVDSPGTTGGVNIIDGATSNTVTSLDWNKTLQESSLKLYDTTSGLSTNSLTLKSDGNIDAPLASNPTQDGHLVNKGYLDKVKTYSFNKIAGASTTSNTYTQLNALTIPASLVPDGSVWELKFSMTYNMNTTNRSAYLRFSIDGGVSWSEVRRESKDVTDNIPAYYAFPRLYTTSQDIELIVEYRTEQNGDVLNVLFIDIMAERKV